MEQEKTEGSLAGTADWPRVLGLFAIVAFAAIFVQPGVVIGVPLACLLALRGFGNLVSVAVIGLVILIVAGGRDPLDDGLWYAERAWSVLLGGWFVGLALLVPSWRLTSRALAAVSGTAAMVATFFAVRVGAWGALDDAVSRTLQYQVEAMIQSVEAFGGGSTLPPELVEMARSVAAAQAFAFPALLGIESLAALGLAWWARMRLLGDKGPALAPVRDFRFNDHLVWLLVAGLMLLVAQTGGAWSRVGSNAVVFMGALYALRGFGVVLFVTGGMSFVVSLFIGLILLLSPMLVFGTAALIGVGDTWLDLRARSTGTVV